MAHFRKKVLGCA